MQLPEIDTPALLLDLDLVERNIATMAAFFSTQRADLRPHFKTPKCPQVARLQLEAGAIGITCSKIGEAEEIAKAGLDASVLIANQIIGAPKLTRLVELAARLPVLIVVSPDWVAMDLDPKGGGVSGNLVARHRGTHDFDVTEFQSCWRNLGIQVSEFPHWLSQDSMLNGRTNVMVGVPAGEQARPAVSLVNGSGPT